MKRTFLITSLFIAQCFSEPVSCGMIGDGRVLDKKGCKCAFRIYEDEARIVVGTCSKGGFISYVLDYKINDRWVKAYAFGCEKLDGVKKYSCTSYDMSKENWHDMPELTTVNTADLRNSLDDRLDPGDMEYLGLKLKY